MNGAHDMGGVHGFGPVIPEENEPTFHAEWEGRVFALTLAAGRAGQWNIDMGRFARENRPPADYHAKSYYEIWLAGLEAMLAERSLVSAKEIDAGRPLGEPIKVGAILQHGSVVAALHSGRPTERPASVPARFRIGDRVRAENIHPTTHTRLPRYVRGRALRASPRDRQARFHSSSLHGSPQASDSRARSAPCRCSIGRPCLRRG